MNKKLNILLVDDDEVDIMTVKRAFKKNNLSSQLWVAHNGLEALDVLRDDLYPKQGRLILLDLNMPKMNGIEFLHQLRSDVNLKQTTVIVLTTSNGDKDKVEAYNFNVAGYLLKPVTFDKFVELIATFNNYWSLSETI